MGPSNANADCDCEHSIVSCYTTEERDGKFVCVTCEEVAADFVDFLWSTGSLVVILGILLIMTSIAQALVVAKNLLNQESLAVLAFADFYFFFGVVHTVIKKRRIANSIGDVCDSAPIIDPMDYAPVTMGNLCHYDWLLKLILIFCVLLIGIAVLNVCWTLFGAAVGIPADFEKMDEGDARELPHTLGSATEHGDRELAQRSPAAAPSGATSDIRVEIDETRDPQRN